MSQETTKQGFDEWALVEIMGHQRIAGRVTEQEIGGQKFVRVDVPPVGGQATQAVTKFFGAGSIYCITPMTEESALRMAMGISTAPVSAWDAREMVKRLDAAKPGELPASSAGEDDQYDEDDEILS